MWRYIVSDILDKPAASIFVKLKASMLQRLIGLVRHPTAFPVDLHPNKPKFKYLERIRYLY
jgi:hypothetical protein